MRWRSTVGYDDGDYDVYREPFLNIRVPRSYSIFCLYICLIILLPQREHIWLERKDTDLPAPYVCSTE